MDEVCIGERLQSFIVELVVHFNWCCHGVVLLHATFLQQFFVRLLLVKNNTFRGALKPYTDTVLAYPESLLVSKPELNF